MSAAVYRGLIWHARTEPLRHEFVYPAAFVTVDLGALRRSSFGWRLGYNRPAFLSIRDGDYLAPDGRPISEKLAAVMPGADPERIVMLTVPRMLARSFNPLTGYFVRDAAGAVTRFGVEVSNTYGERYFYDLQPSRAPDGRLTAVAPKAMYVSPFHGVQGQYRFSAAMAPDRVELTVDLEVDGRVLVATSLSGRGKPLADASFLDLMRVGASGVFAWPRIVSQALRLRAKGLRPVMKPRPPAGALREGSGR